MYQNDQYNIEEKGISILGIVSIIIALITGLIFFVVIGGGVYLEMSTPGGIQDDSPILGVIGLAAIFIIVSHAIGAGLGFAGLFQKSKKKLFAAIGAFLNSFLVLTIIGIMVVGLIFE